MNHRFITIFPVFFLVLTAIFSRTAFAEPGFLGMQVQGITPEIGVILGVEGTKGVLVRDVALGGPAAGAGFRRGDLIIEFAGKAVENFAGFISAVKALTTGRAVGAAVIRKGVKRTLTLKTGDWPEALRIGRGSFAAIPEIGLTLAALTEKVRRRFEMRWGVMGVVITLIDPLKAKDLGLRRGDLIVQVNQEDVWRPKQFVKLYQKAKKAGQKRLLLLVEGPSGYRFSLLKVK